MSSASASLLCIRWQVYWYSNTFNFLFRGHELTVDDQMLVTEADEIMSRVGDPQGTYIFQIVLGFQFFLLDSIQTFLYTSVIYLRSVSVNGL